MTSRSAVGNNSFYYLRVTAIKDQTHQTVHTGHDDDDGDDDDDDDDDDEDEDDDDDDDGDDDDDDDGDDDDDDGDDDDDDEGLQQQEAVGRISLHVQRRSHRDRRREGLRTSGPITAQTLKSTVINFI